MRIQSSCRKVMVIMKNSNITDVERKYSVADVFANQHPVINCWIAFSAIAIVALYAITFTTL